jgi:hypothetical protein
MKPIAVLALLAAGVASAQNNSPLDFVNGLTEHQRIRSALTNHLNDQAMRLLETRRQALSASPRLMTSPPARLACARISWRRWASGRNRAR